MAIVIPIASKWDPKGLDKATSDIKRAESGWGKVGAGVKAAALPAAAGLAAVGAAGFKFAKMASEDAASASKMAKALQNSVGATDEQVASTEAWITAQGKALGVADDELRPAIQTLAAASGDLGQAQKDAALAMDIAAASGTDTETAAKAIAKAYDGSFGSLKKLVPGIDDAALAQKDLGKVMESTNDLVGGQAADAAATSEGQQKKLQLSLSETAETLGAVLLPALGALTGILQKAADWISENTTLVLVLVGAFVAVASAILIANAAIAAYSTITKIISAATKVWAGLQWALNAALAANPIVLVVLAVLLLVGVIILLWKKCETFRKIVTAVFDGFLGIVKGAWQWIKANWPLLLAILLGPIGIAVGLIVKNWDKIKAGAKAVLDWLKGAFQKAKDWLTKPFDAWWAVVSGIIDKVKGAIQSVLDLIGRIKLPKLPDLNPFNNSAPAAAAALAVPAGRAGVSALAVGGSSTTNLSVSGAVDAEGTARVVQQMLDRHANRQGRSTGAPRRRAW